MVDGIPGNSPVPASGSLLATWLERLTPHPDSFVCGVRVRDGALRGERARWRYRRSAVDRLVLGGVVTLYHGKVRLRVRFAGPVGDARPLGVRPGYVVWAGTEQSSGAKILVTFPVGQTHRFPAESEAGREDDA